MSTEQPGPSWKSGRAAKRPNQAKAKQPKALSGAQSTSTNEPGIDMPEWMVKQRRRQPRAKLGRHVKLLFFFCLFVALCVVLVPLLWPKIDTPFIAAIGADYTAPLPPNGWAGEDMERFQRLNHFTSTDLAGNSTVHYPLILQCRGGIWASKETGLDNLEKELHDVTPGGPDKNLVIVYVSMHGVVNGNNEPCLIPPGASPFISNDWIRVSDLIDRIHDKAKSEKKYKTLLVLDCARMEANWNAGLLYNSFAAALEAVVNHKRSEGDDVYVLASSSPGQIAWTAPELHGSVFAYFLARGLHGAAGEEGLGLRTTIHLKEIVSYVTAEVKRWVKEHRDDDQEPMLLAGDADDFPVVYRTSSVESEADQKSDDTRWDEIAKLWDEHQRLLANGEKVDLDAHLPYRDRPLFWELLQQKLLRLEMLAQAGSQGIQEVDKLKKQVNEDFVKFKSTDSVDERSISSLPLAKQLLGQPNPQDVEALSPPWNTTPPAASVSARGADKSTTIIVAQPIDAQKAGAAAPAKAPEEIAPIEIRKHTYLAAADSLATMFCPQSQSVSRPTLKRQKVGEWLDYVAKSVPNRETDVSEISFLRFLHRDLDPSVWVENNDCISDAMALRCKAEKSAAPDDLRVYPWIESSLQTADDKRRKAEDTLFVGSITAVNKELYRDVDNCSADVTDALRIRDQVWAETPYYAQWFFSRLRSDDEGSKDKDLAARLQRLIDNVQSLGAGLDDPHGAGLPEDLKQLVHDLQTDRNELQSELEKECTRMSTLALDAPTLKQIMGLLSIPLVTGKHRRDLRDKYAAIVSDMQRRSKGISSNIEEGAHNPATKAGEGTKPSNATLSPDVILSRLQYFEKHPLPAESILSRIRLSGSHEITPANGWNEETLVKKEETLAKKSEQLRQALVAVCSNNKEGLSGWCGESKEKLNDKSPASASEARLGCSMADRLIRAAAPLMSEPTALVDEEPALLLHKVDLRYLLLGQAQRALDDFWGPLPNNPQPYFEIVTKAYLDAANAVCPGSSNLPGRLENYRSAAENGPVIPKATKVFFSDGSQPLQHGFAIDVALGTPPGEAAIFLEQGDGKVFPVKSPTPDGQFVLTHRDGRQIDRPGRLRPFNFELDSLGPNGSLDLIAVCYYRGHRQAVGFHLQSGKWHDIAYEPPTPTETRVTVKGEIPVQPVSVQFILDCSHSMNETITIGQAVGQTRLNAARDKLIDMLASMVDKPYAVGIWAFGHRYQWAGKKASNGFYTPDGTLKQVVNEEGAIDPTNDFELLHECKPGTKLFDASECKLCTEKLNQLEAKGATPLYLTIIKAVDRLRDETSAIDKRIVVITDGSNDQNGGNQKSQITRDKVEETFKSERARGIRLDILRIQAETKQHKDADETDEHFEILKRREDDSRKDLDVLLQNVHGKLYTNSDPSELLAAMKSSLDLIKVKAQYNVSKTSHGSEQFEKQRELNKTCQLPSPGNYIVSLPGGIPTGLRVEGGEDFQLHRTLDDHGIVRIVHERYTGNVELRDPLTHADHVACPEDSSRRFAIGACVSDRAKSTFQILFKNDDETQFSPRPAEGWIEISPQPQTGLNTKYCFTDLQFENGTPVPVIECPVANWPKDAPASIRAWFCLEKVRPDFQFTVRDGHKGLTLSGLPGHATVRFTTRILDRRPPEDPVQLIVDETFIAEGKPPELKVALDSAGILPVRVVHHYPDENGMTVRHDFIFGKDVSRKDLEDCRIEVTRKESIVAHAIQTTDPLVAKLPQ